MAEFSEGCPMRGTCIGPIDRIKPIDSPPEYPEVSDVVVAIDSQGNSSKPINLGERTSEDVKEALDNCPGIALEKRLPIINSIFGPKRHCPALGHLALDRSNIS